MLRQLMLRLSSAHILSCISSLWPGLKMIVVEIWVANLYLPISMIIVLKQSNQTNRREATCTPSMWQDAQISSPHMTPE